MNLLTQDDQHMLHLRYRQNDLYRHWTPILAQLHRDYGEADPQSLWFAAERQIERLRNVSEYREQEIGLIYEDLLGDCRHFDNISRTEEEAQRSAITLMAILLTMLLNAIQPGHEDEPFANQPICVAIMDIVKDDPYYKKLIDTFFARNVDYDGNKVHITPHDPMTDKSQLEEMADEVVEAVRLMAQRVTEHTQGLKPLLGSHWETWEQLWLRLLADNELLVLARQVEPRRNEWGLNQKMVCNVLGLYKETTKLETPFSALNDAISKKRLRNYISNFLDLAGSDSVFNATIYEKVKQIVEETILAAQS